jgi:ankyrin repeat protein
MKYKYYVNKMNEEVQNNINESLIIAAKHGYVETVEFLLSGGADIHTKSDSPVSDAILNNHIEVVKLLLNKGAKIGLGIFENVIKKHMRNGGNLELIELLLQNGETKDIDIYMYYSVIQSIVDLAYLLMKYGADINANNDELLFYSVQEGNIGMLEFLVDNGADIHNRNNSIIIFAVQDNLPSRYIDRGEGVLIVLKYLLKNHFPKNIIKRALAKVKGSEDDIDIKCSRMLMNYLRKDKTVELSESLKNAIRKLDFKWQDICYKLDKEGKEDLEGMAKELGLDYRNKTKRELCKLISEDMLSIVESCEDENLSGESLNGLPKWRIFKIKNNNKVEVCYDILDLKQILDSGETRNPYTREKLPIDDINDRVGRLTSLSMRNRLESETFIERVKINPLVDVNQLVVSLFAKFPYMIDPSIIIDASDSDIEKISQELFRGKANNIFKVEKNRVSKITETSGNKKKRLFINLLLELGKDYDLFKLIYFAFSYFDKEKKGEDLRNEMYLAIINQ